MYLEAALAYAARGWRVFALAPKQKIPRKGTRGVLDATTDPEVIRGWWADIPDANIGLACGVQSDLFVVDIDPRHEGDATFNALQETHGILPSTVYVLTGGGGYQFYFHHCPNIANGAGRLGKGIDHRSDGGYVVAPPSLHPSGERYKFNEGYAPDDVDLADLPSWIEGGLRKDKAGPKAPLAPEFYRDLFARGAKAGERNDAIIRMTGHLIRKKLDPFLVLDIMTLWNQHRLEPPGDPEKLTGIVDRVAAKELERINKGRQVR